MCYLVWAFEPEPRKMTTNKSLFVHVFGAVLDFMDHEIQEASNLIHPPLHTIQPKCRMIDQDF